MRVACTSEVNDLYWRGTFEADKTKWHNRTNLESSSFCYTWGLTFSSHVDNTCFTTSFNYEERSLPFKTGFAPPLWLSACNEPRKGVVMYLFVKGVNFSFFYGFGNEFWYRSYSVVFFVHVLLRSAYFYIVNIAVISNNFL